MKRVIIKYSLLAVAVCFCCNIICFYASRPSREAIEEAYRFCQNNDKHSALQLFAKNHIFVLVRSFFIRGGAQSVPPFA